MSFDLPTTYAIAAGAALAAGLVGTFAVRATALRLGIVNAPNPLIPQHTKPVAYLGGVGVALGIATGLAALRVLGAEVPGLAILLPAVLFLALGVADDLLVFKPAPKFGLQALVAALAVALGVRAELTGIAAIDAAASWFWLVTLVNAFNFTDVCDGLLGSLGAVMFVGLAIQNPAVAGPALIAAAACLGFLAFNRPPASIFLGDAGSHLLGFLAGAFTLAAAARAESPVLTLGAGGLIVAVPLFELAFLTAVRIRKGLAWWKGSPDHFSLRLQAAGFSRGRTDLLAVAFAAAWVVCGLVFARGGAAAVAALLFVIVSAAVAAAYLLRHEVRPKAARVAAERVDPGVGLESPVPCVCTQQV